MFKINTRLDHQNCEELLVNKLKKSFDIYINRIIKQRLIEGLLLSDNWVTKIEANNTTITLQLDYIKPGKVSNTGVRLNSSQLAHNKTTQNEGGIS